MFRLGKELLIIFSAIILGLGAASMVSADVNMVAARILQSTVKFFSVTATTNCIATNSVDAADSNEVCVTGGGACEAVGTVVRGGKLVVTGNEHADRPGEAYLEANGLARLRAAAGPVQLRGDNTIVQSASGTTNWTFNAAAGTVIGTGTSSIGWTVKNAAGVACNTTCVTPCVFGQDNDAGNIIVLCTDATADTCLCAGAS